MSDNSNLTLKLTVGAVTHCSPVKMGATAGTCTAPTATTDHVIGFVPFGSDYAVGDHVPVLSSGQVIKVRLGATLATPGVPLVLHASNFDRLTTATINIAGGSTNTQILGYLIDAGVDGDIVRMEYAPSLASV